MSEVRKLKLISLENVEKDSVIFELNNPDGRASLEWVRKNTPSFFKGKRIKKENFGLATAYPDWFCCHTFYGLKEVRERLSRFFGQLIT